MLQGRLTTEHYSKLCICFTCAKLRLISGSFRAKWVSREAIGFLGRESLTTDHRPPTTSEAIVATTDVASASILYPPSRIAATLPSHNSSASWRTLWANWLKPAVVTAM